MANGYFKDITKFIVGSWLMIFLLIALACLFLVNPVYAIGLGVKPTEINLKVVIGKPTETELLVMNVTNQPAYYQVYPDAFADQIMVGPTDFRLEPETSQIIKVKINPKNPGRFATNISIVARPLDAAGLSAASGVKVPITLEVSGLPFFRLLIGIVVGICLLLIFGVKLLRRQVTRDK